MAIIFAHRGASFEAPENTIPAFQLALDQGCRAIELDVHLSKDGHLMVCHDASIDRTTDGTGYIRDQTLKGLKKRDAGSWFSTKYRGTPIPTLEEVLEICTKDIFINIEIKNIPFFYQDIEKKIVRTVKRFGFEKNTLVSSFDHYALHRVQTLEPNIRLGILLFNQLIDPWTYIHQVGLKAYSIHSLYTFIDPSFVQWSHQQGYLVFSYTVDDRKVYQYLQSIGVDGILTNIPARFL